MTNVDRVAADQIENATVDGIIGQLYGSVQATIDGGANEDTAYHYFMPPMPISRDFTAFMDIAQDDSDGGLDGKSRADAAVYFAKLFDIVPSLDESELLDFDPFSPSGMTVSQVYEAVLRNCLVVDNQLSEENQQKLESWRSLLYIDPPPTQLPDEPVDEIDDLELSDDELLASFGSIAEEGEIDVDGMLASNFPPDDNMADDPGRRETMTTAMQLYDVLRQRYEEADLEHLLYVRQLDPRDVITPRVIKASKRKVDRALAQWKVQGRKTKIEAIQARIDQLSQGGMVKYVADLRTRFESAEILATVIEGDETTKSAHYTALLPSGVLRASSGLKIKISNSESSTKHHYRNRSGSASAGYTPWFRAKGSYDRTDREDETAQSDYTIEFEIVHGLIDRSQWFDQSFLECRAYTTTDPESGVALDLTAEITTLSDGKRPPELGHLPVVPTSAYFIRNLQLTSSALADLSEEEKRDFDAEGGASFLGFGGKLSYSDSRVDSSGSSASSTGTLTADGTYLIALGSTYLEKAPNPDFERFPYEDGKWIGPDGGS